MSTLHFLNVGHGDCTVIEHDSGRVTVIDVNNCSKLDETSEGEVLAGLSSLSAALYRVLRGGGLRERAALQKAGYSIPVTNPIEFLSQRLSGKSIFRYIQTHPDLDHMRGLSILERSFSIVNFWDTEHVKKIASYSCDADKDDWTTYQRLRNGTNPKVLRLKRGATGSFFNAGAQADLGDGLHVYAPTPRLVTDANERQSWNDLSYVLALREHGRTVILGGDAGDIVSSDVVATFGTRLRCDVLKASHHGRESGFHGDAVSAMKPGLTIVSVGKKPDQDASDSYRLHSAFVWSTRWKGDITLRIEVSGEMKAASSYNNEPLIWKKRAA